MRLEKKQKFQKMLENLDYRRQPGETNYKQDLDMYVNRIVNNKIGDGGFNEYNKYEWLLTMAGSRRN